MGIAYVMPSITYCQGMNCIGGALLHILGDEEKSFFMFYAMIKNWDLEKVFEPGLPDLLLREFQYNFYAKKLMPDLFNHFKQEDITTGFFMSRWFLTIFSIYLPVDMTTRVWDCIFHSKWKSIIKISLSLMLELKQKLICMDKAGISCFLRDSVRENYSNCSAMLKKAYTIKVRNKHLNDLKEKFHIQVADYKLNNSEPYFTNDELAALSKTKLRLAEQSSERVKKIQEIQKSIELHGKIIENYKRESYSLSQQIHELENIIENHCEKKAALIKTLDELQDRYQKEQANTSEDPPTNAFILKEDLIIIQEKIKNIDDTLKELTKEYINKVITS